MVAAHDGVVLPKAVMIALISRPRVTAERSATSVVAATEARVFPDLLTACCVVFIGCAPVATVSEEQAVRDGKPQGAVARSPPLDVLRHARDRGRRAAGRRAGSP